MEEIFENFDTVTNVILSPAEFAENLREKLKTFINDDDAVNNLLLELLAIIICDCGKLIFDFVYEYEGDKFYGDKMHHAKEAVINGLHALVTNHVGCTRLHAKASSEIYGDNINSTEERSYCYKLCESQ